MTKKTNTTINDKSYYRVTADIDIDSNGKRIRKNSRVRKERTRRASVTSI